MFDMELTGFQRVGNSLRALASDMDEEIVDPIMEDWSKDMRYMLKGKAYPTKRPGQKSIRTGRLANEWAARRVKAGVWEISNDARNSSGRMYSVYVVGNNQGSGQVWFHRGRWWVAYDVIRGYVPDLTRRLTRALTDWWEQHG